MQRPPSSIKWVGHEEQANGPAPGVNQCKNFNSNSSLCGIALTVAGFTIVMTFLTAKIGFIEALGTFRMTFTGG